MSNGEKLIGNCGMYKTWWRVKDKDGWTLPIPKTMEVEPFAVKHKEYG